MLTNAVTAIETRDNAHLSHYRLQSEARDSLHIGTLLLRQSGVSRIDSYQLMAGSRLRRNDVRAFSDKSGAELNMNGIFVARGVNSLRSPERGIVLVTHYQRLLDYIVPDFVHVLSNGQIIKSGGKELAHELEEHGYGWLTGDRNDGKDQSA